MKKKLAALALAAALAAAPAQAVVYDLSGMTLADLIELQQQVTAAMWATEEWQEVTVPPGVYQIGVDIPAGYWKISAPDKAHCFAAWGPELDETGTKVANAYDFESIVSSTSPYYGNNEAQYVAWDMDEGYFEVAVGAVIFTPYTGHDLGFKW